MYPVINAQPSEEALVRLRVEQVREHTRMLHLDVCDGTFTEHVTWANPEVWAQIRGGLGLQMHLMVADPVAALEAWLTAGATEVVVHYETLGEQPLEVLQALRMRCEQSGAKLLLAGGVGVPSGDLMACAEEVTGFLLLCVPAGPAGQQIDMNTTLERIAALRSATLLPIGIDGGVTQENHQALQQEGATFAVAASAIWNAPDPIVALAALQ